jgi:hypothetical protein
VRGDQDVPSVSAMRMLLNSTKISQLGKESNWERSEPNKHRAMGYEHLKPLVY